MSNICTDSSRWISQFDTATSVNPCNSDGSIGTYDKPGGSGGGCDCLAPVVEIAGYKALANVHVWTPADIPAFSKATMSGEFTLYLQNKSDNRINVTLLLISKVSGVASAIIYQKLGNYPSTGGVAVDATQLGTSGILSVVYTPAAEARWLFRGF